MLRENSIKLTNFKTLRREVHSIRYDVEKSVGPTNASRKNEAERITVLWLAQQERERVRERDRDRERVAERDREKFCFNQLVLIYCHSTTTVQPGYILRKHSIESWFVTSLTHETRAKHQHINFFFEKSSFSL